MNFNLCAGQSLSTLSRARILRVETCLPPWNCPGANLEVPNGK